jgi:hypothetical protein
MWSPDSRKLAYVTVIRNPQNPFGDRWDLMVVDMATADRAPVSLTTNSAGARICGPVSGDDEKILYGKLEPGLGVVYWVDADGGSSSQRVSDRIGDSAGAFQKELDLTVARIREAAEKGNQSEVRESCDRLWASSPYIVGRLRKVNQACRDAVNDKDRRDTPRNKEAVLAKFFEFWAKANNSEAIPGPAVALLAGYKMSELKSPFEQGIRVMQADREVRLFL